MDPKKSEVLQGTLDLMILKTLHGLGPLSRFWRRPPHRAAQRGSAATERRHRLYLTAATPAAWMDSFGVGHVGTTAKPSSTPSPGMGRNSWQLRRKAGSGCQA
jgi:hypothetical protein